MDSTVVNKEIRRRIWPVLKERKFTMFTPRTAWRYTPKCIHVVNFQSFNSYLAEGVGCTTFSFALNLGCYFTAVPNEVGLDATTVKGGLSRPKEYECHFRRALQKTLCQPVLPRGNIWYVAEDGKNLSEVMDDAGRAVVREGVAWLERFQEYGEVLRTLNQDDEDMGGTWGFGRNPSPRRHYLTGYIALALGDRAQTVSHLQQALSSGCFTSVREQVTAAIAAAQ